MCRFLAYKGREIFMSDLLLKTEQSLIIQSYKAKERKEPLNGDGFGVGWYAHDIDPTPCVYVSIQPAWSNRNLFRLSEKIRSSCFFAHIRAATRGLYVSEFNCHPFQYQQFLWMHNGKIAEFDNIKRRLRESLNDQFYNFIQGTTDSEHAFAVFLNNLNQNLDHYTIDDLKDALLTTISQINQWQAQAGNTSSSYLNFAISDGHHLLVSRYCSRIDDEPPSLYISIGDRFEIKENRYRMVQDQGHPNTLIVASEPLTDERSDWQAVRKNHLLIVSPELHIQQIPIV